MTSEICDVDDSAKEMSSSSTTDSQMPLMEDHRSESATTSTQIHDLTDEHDGGRRRMGRSWPRCCAISGLVTAVVCAILALTFPLLYHAILNYELSLQKGTFTYKMWEEPPIDMYIKLYFFNITNSEEILENNQAKPVLQQCGPYTFKESHHRVNIQPHDNYTMTYQQRRVWHFVEELSNGTLADNITTLNVPLVGATYTLRFQPLWYKVGFNRIVRLLGSQLFVTKNASELTFEGYADPLLELGKRLPPGTFPPFDKFGWFYQRNNSESFDGVFNVFTGADHISKVGEMDLWNYSSHTNFYESYCGMVNGSFGEAWAPRRNKTSISMYVTDICRSVTLDYEKEVIDAGVPAYRYTATEKVFANATVHPDNWCFCSGGACNPSGIGNSSTCRFGAPVFTSYPHFYLADPYYIDQVEGLRPEKDLHQFYIDLEPEMAVPTSVRARLQINILIEPDIDIDAVRNLNRTFLPLVWFELSADLTPDLGVWINLANRVPVFGTAAFFGFLCLSLVAVAVSGVFLVKRRSRTHAIASVDPASKESDMIDS
ncbi:protein croquemort-like isoform X2 [Daphnia pulicaria]|nr:protein croquemort-like isoform X2 [Daphnia pulicaria]XP_046644994.1 protein croquemort-like isoform X2 [Daphnia pulicaria]